LAICKLWVSTSDSIVVVSVEMSLSSTSISKSFSDPIKSKEFIGRLVAESDERSGRTGLVRVTLTDGRVLTGSVYTVDHRGNVVMMDVDEEFNHQSGEVRRRRMHLVNVPRHCAEKYEFKTLAVERCLEDPLPASD